MIRVLLFLAVVALMAFGVAWFAERPGEVAVVWQGYRIETSLMVAAAAVGIVVLLALIVWSIVRTILRSPDLIATYMSQRRGVRGYLGISRGLIAIGAGDAAAARRASHEVEKIAGGEPLALLLNAQVAQLSGDRAAAEQAFRAMTERADTKLLGLRGLYIEAQRRKDNAAAHAYAEEAAKVAPSLGWAGQAALEFRCAAGDWSGALAALDRNSRYGLIDKPQYRRQRAVLLTARALATEDSDRARARQFALDALRLEPALVPAAELAGRLLGEAGEMRRAGRVIEKAWAVHPHPDLADTYAHLRPGDSARERLARVQSLARRAPATGSAHPESALAVARAAIDAQEFAVARNAIRPLLKEPTQRAAALMAEIEQRESGDEGRAREWMGRALRAPRDPAWTADGFVSDRWMPVSPVSGRLDAFQWKVPLAELGEAREIVAAEDWVRAAGPKIVAPVPAPSSSQPTVEVSAETPAAPVVTPPPATATESPPPPPPTSEPRAEAVIPLLPVPDDPGPDPLHDPEPEPAPPGGARGTRLFK
jgi:HemY protein